MAGTVYFTHDGKDYTVKITAWFSYKDSGYIEFYNLEIQGFGGVSSCDDFYLNDEIRMNKAELETGYGVLRDAAEIVRDFILTRHTREHPLIEYDGIFSEPGRFYPVYVSSDLAGVFEWDLNYS